MALGLGVTEITEKLGEPKEARMRPRKVRIYVNGSSG